MGDKGKGKGQKCKICGKDNHETADCRDKAPVCQGHYKNDCKTPNCQKYHPAVCSFWQAGTCQKTNFMFLHRNSNWTKPKPAAPAPYEKARPDSPAPITYTKAQKKEYKAAQKAEEEKATAKKEKRKASKARKKAATGAVATTVTTADGISPLNR